MLKHQLQGYNIVPEVDEIAGKEKYEVMDEDK
jgi:hypothetical protein